MPLGGCLVMFLQRHELIESEQSAERDALVVVVDVIEFTLV